MAAPVASCPTISDEMRHSLVKRLFHLGCINFDGVPLKTGEISPVYFDIRLTMSDPALLEDLSRELYKMVAEVSKEKFDLVVGVPSAAIALATEISVQNKIPQILCRTAAKDHGTKKLIEGIWQKEQNTLVVEDVVTYGDSIAQCSCILRECGLTVRHACVVVERQQGATQQLLMNHNIRLHALLTFNDILSTLLDDGLLTVERLDTARKYNAVWQYEIMKAPTVPAMSKFCPTLATKLTKIMSVKTTNVCLSIDTVISTELLLKVVRTAGPSVAAIQLNTNFLTDYSSKLAEDLRQFAEKYNFILIGDFNFSGDEKTTSLQLDESSHTKLSKWCDVVTVHGLSGNGVLGALLKHNATSKRLLAAMVIADPNYSQINTSYQTMCVNLAKSYKEICLGFVSAEPLGDLPQTAKSDDVPNNFYLVPAALHLNGLKSHHNGDTSGVGAFDKSYKGVLYSINLSELNELDIGLPAIVKEKYVFPV